MTLAKNSLFISYRKDDAGGWAARLADKLRAVLGDEAVFIDDGVGIPTGSPWPDRIAIALDQCRVFISVIAPDWHQEPNLSRLKNPDDWVRKELITAHTRQASVLRVPVFVNEAGPLDPALFSDNPELSEAVHSLMDQQGIKLDRSPEHWPSKISGLVTRIEAHTGVSVLRDMSKSKNETLADRYLKRLKNNTLIAIISVTGVVIISTATITASLKTVFEPFQSTKNSVKTPDNVSVKIHTLLKTGQVDKVIVSGHAFSITIEVVREGTNTVAIGHISHKLNFRKDDNASFTIQKVGENVKNVDFDFKRGGVSNPVNFSVKEIQELESTKIKEGAAPEDAMKYLLANIVERLN